MKVVEHDAQSLRVSWAAGGGKRRDYLRRAATLIDFRFGKTADRHERNRKIVTKRATGLVGAPGLEPGTR
jgi:hypothetical protein